MKKTNHSIKWKTIETKIPDSTKDAILIIEYPEGLPFAIIPLHTSKTEIEKLRSKARLIAAAPELLETLTELVEIFNYDEQNIYAFASKAIDKARSLIDNNSSGRAS